MEDEAGLYAITLTLLICCASLSFLILDDEDEDSPNDEAATQQNIADALLVLRRIRKRAFKGEEVDEDAPQQKRKKYDYARAMMCVQADYLGPDPLFEKQFERIFRVTRGITERVMQVCGNASPFFTLRKLVTGEDGIHPEVKVLMALKTLAFGCSSVAFVDYFQMSTTSGKDCVKNLAAIIAKSELRDTYLRKMTRADAKRVSDLHQVKFGVPGCIGCLDCMHVFWRTCPVAWQGQYQGKEGKPSIVLEGMGDYTTWIWHLTFGFPGTLNDINIWDQSTLLRSFLDGSFVEGVDFLYQIGDEVFDKLFILVDGIYPELSRFVKTFSVPLTTKETKFAGWQESMRKAIERSFGIVQRKFQILCRPIELWFEDDIRNIVETCFILHNMMVEVRLGRDQEEEEGWYHLVEEDEDEDEEDSFIGRHAVDLEEHGLVAEKPTLKQRIETIVSVWPLPNQQRSLAIREAVQEHFVDAQVHWDGLYNVQEHFRLRDAIATQVC